MKTKLIILIGIFIPFFSIGQDTDSLKLVGFKPFISEYIEKVEKILVKLDSTDNADSIKHYADEIILISGKMEISADDYFGFQPSSVKYAMVVGTEPSYQPVYLSSIGKKPIVSSCAVKIHDISCAIYWFTKNKEKRENRIANIRETIQVIREYYSLNKEH